jgi:hypothetical protein
VFEAILLPDARRARDRLAEVDRREVNRIIRLLELNPWADNTTKFVVNLGQDIAGVYDDNRWEVVYRIVDDRFIEVIGISRISG